MSNQPEIRCLSCSVLSVREARFCRQCGALLRFDDLIGRGEVSPDALTVELSEPKRQTSPLAPLEERTTGPHIPVATAEVGMGLPREYSVRNRILGGRARNVAAIALLLVAGIAGVSMWRRAHHRPAFASESWAVAKLEPFSEPREDVTPGPIGETDLVDEAPGRVPTVRRRAPGYVPATRVLFRPRKHFKIVEITKAHPSSNGVRLDFPNQTARLATRPRPTLTIRRAHARDVGTSRASNILGVRNVKHYRRTAKN